MTDMTVHVGDGRGKPKKPRGQFWLALPWAVVLPLAAGGLVGYLRYKDRSSSILGKPPAIPDSVSDSKSLLQSGKTDEAEKSVQDALAKKSISNEEKQLLYVEQGRIAIVKEDYQAAVEAFTKAWEIK